MIYFVTSIEESVVRTLLPSITSSFDKHSLSAAVTIVSSIIGGLTKLPLAKILDTWGRPQGLTLMLTICVIGFIMTAAAPNIETYAAANVFSAVGAQGVSYCVTIFIADTSTLRNRALMLAFATSPYVITTWFGGFVAQAVYDGPGWRWGFGIWAIVCPVIVLPLSGLFIWNNIKAKKQGLLETKKTPLTWKRVYDYLVEIDIVGLLLLALGWTLFLLPFSMWSFQTEKWRAPIIICFLVFGVLSLIAFIVWERYFAPVTFIPYKLIMDRTVFFGGLMFIFNFAAGSIWRGFFTSMLYVVWNVSRAQAGYIGNIYRVGSCGAAVIIGLLIRRYGRFKWAATFYALPLMILGVGLMLHFRQAYQSIGFVIMTQIFVAFAGGPVVLAGEMAMMAPSDHQHVAVIMAILDLFCSIGSAIGSAISSAIWTGTFYRELSNRLPAGAPIDKIYKSIEWQTKFAPGSIERIAISEAYSASQRYMLIPSVCLLFCAWLCSWAWRDLDIRKNDQVEGVVV